MLHLLNPLDDSQCSLSDWQALSGQYTGYFTCLVCRDEKLVQCKYIKKHEDSKQHQRRLAKRPHTGPSSSASSHLGAQRQPSMQNEYTHHTGTPWTDPAPLQADVGDFSSISFASVDRSALLDISTPLVDVLDKWCPGSTGNYEDSGAVNDATFGGLDWSAIPHRQHHLCSKDAQMQAHVSACLASYIRRSHHIHCESDEEDGEHDALEEQRETDAMHSSSVGNAGTSSLDETGNDTQQGLHPLSVVSSNRQP